MDAVLDKNAPADDGGDANDPDTDIDINAADPADEVDTVDMVDAADEARLAAVCSADVIADKSAVGPRGEACAFAEDDDEEEDDDEVEEERG